jgi:hypothetical protein
MPGRVALVAARIIESPTCVNCIAMQSAVAPPDVEVALSEIQRVLVLYQEGSGQCHSCGIIGPVASLTPEELQPDVAGRRDSRRLHPARYRSSRRAP